MANLKFKNPNKLFAKYEFIYASSRKTFLFMESQTLHMVKHIENLEFLGILENTI
jgi:hypothetical protein